MTGSNSDTFVVEFSSDPIIQFVRPDLHLYFFTETGSTVSCSYRKSFNLTSKTFRLKICLCLGFFFLSPVIMILSYSCKDV